MANVGSSQERTADRVADNIRSVRHARGLDLADVSARLEKLRHPLGLSTVCKIELGKRRLDVEDLVALAVALNVTPNRLLFTGTAGGADVALTPGFGTTEVQAWRWAAGDQPLPQAEPWRRRRQADFSRERIDRFHVENRPHNPEVGTLTAADIQEHAEGLGIVLRAVQQAKAKGVPMSVISGWFRLGEAMQELTNDIGRLVDNARR